MTSLFEKFSQKVKSTTGVALRPAVRRPPLTRQIIKATSWDEVDWKNARRDPEIDKAVTDLYLGDLHNPDDRPGYLNAPELLQDIFMTFLKPVPMLRKKREVQKDARLNGKFIEQLMALGDWERLHDHTATDAMFSKMATTVVMDALKAMIREHRDAINKTNDDRQNSDDPDPNGPPGSNPQKESWDEETPGDSGSGQQQGQGEPGDQSEQDGQSKVDQMQQPTSENNEAPWGSEEEMREQIKQALEEQQQDGGAGGEYSDGDADGDGGEEDDPTGGNQEFNDDFRDEEHEGETDWETLLEHIDFGRYVSGALQEAVDKLDDIEAARKGIGVEDEEWRMMDPTARLAIAEKLNTPRMKLIADMVGRMKRFALSKKALKVIDAPHEIVNVEMGPVDVRRIIPSEFAFLGHEGAQYAFYAKLVNDELLQYRQQGHEEVGKGPAIVCIDNSGSMGGSPENWAKGVAEAVRRLCAEDERDFYAMYFGTNSHRQRFDFPKGKGAFEKVLTFLSVSAGGGTEFDGVLTEALAKCETAFEGEGKGKADIVFITDGEARLSETWVTKFKQERDAMGVRVFGIYISASDSNRSTALKVLESFCHTVVPVKELQVNDQASSLLFDVF